MAHRLFVAIEISEQAKAILAKSQEQLKALSVAEGKYTDAMNLHLTLKFIGNVEEANIPRVIELLRNVAVQPLKLSLGVLGKFPENGPSTHVVWASVLGEGVAELASQIESELAEIVRPSEHPYHAHLTLLRVARCNDEQKLAKALPNIHVEPLEFAATGFSLIRSKLSHVGPSHEVIAIF
jgi:2'-5' RNA ligase